MKAREVSLQEFAERVMAAPAKDSLLPEAIELLRTTPDDSFADAWATLCGAFDAPELIGAMAVRELAQDTFWAKKLRAVIAPTTSAAPKCIGMFYYTLRNGGAQRVAAMLVRLWHSMGHRVVVFTDGEPLPDEYELPADAVRISLPALRLDEADSRRERIRRLHDAVQAYGVDVFVYHAWLSPMLLWDMLAVKQAGAAFYVHTHSIFSMMAMEPALHDRFRATQQVYALADGVLCMTKTDEQYWRHFCGKVLRVVHPLPFDLRDVKPSPLNGQRMLWVGRVSEEKHPEHALEILAQVRQAVPQATLTLVGGDAEAVAALRRRAEALGVADAVELPGFQTDVSSFYEQADVFLCTSDYEGFCLTIMEAQSHGVPVVTYDMPYLPLLESGKGSLAVARGDIAAAAQAAASLLNDTDRRRRIGRDARENVEACVPDDYAAMWRDILASAAEPGAAPANAEHALMLETLAEHLSMQKTGAGASTLPTPTKGPFRTLRRKACTFINLLLLEGWSGVRKALAGRKK